MAKINAEFVKQANAERAAWRRLRQAIEAARRVIACHNAHDYSDCNATPKPAYAGVDDNGVIGSADITPADYLSGITSLQAAVTWWDTGGRDSLGNRLAGPNE